LIRFASPVIPHACFDASKETRHTCSGGELIPAAGRRSRSSVAADGSRREFAGVHVVVVVAANAGMDSLLGPAR
jgi:hypothetical protein